MDMLQLMTTLREIGDQFNSWALPINVDGKSIQEVRLEQNDNGAYFVTIKTKQDSELPLN